MTVGRVVAFLFHTGQSHIEGATDFRWEVKMTTVKTDFELTSGGEMVWLYNSRKIESS